MVHFKKITHIFNEPLTRETNLTLGPIQKSLNLLLLYQFTFAQKRPKSDVSGALGPIHYITLKAFALAALGDGTKCKTCFGSPRMILHVEVWLFTTLRDPPTLFGKRPHFFRFFLAPFPYHLA